MPMLSQTDVRLRMKAFGYDIIPLQLNKVPFFGWRTAPNNPENIRYWRGYATGVRLRNSMSLFALDLDVRIEALRDAIVTAYEQRWPAFMAGCLRRHSQATTLMLIGRCCTAKGMRQSSRWHRDADDKKGNLIEVFTSNCGRQIAVQGLHSVGQDSGGRRYGYLGRAIWDTPLDALPWFPDADIDDALNIAEHIMAAHGLVRRMPRPGAAGQRLWDLEPEMCIMLSDGTELTLADLETLIGPARLTAFATLWDPQSSTPDRVLVTGSSTGLSLWDTKTGISHRWRHRGPAADLVELKASIKTLMTGGVS